MKPEEIERFSLDDLQRMAADPGMAVPEGLSARLEEIACGALLAGKGAGALDGLPQTPASTRGHRARRWLWGAVPAVALAAFACVFFASRPKETLPPEAIEAYTQVERAFDLFSEALQMGYDSFSTPTQITQP